MYVMRTPVQKERHFNFVLEVPKPKVIGIDSLEAATTLLFLKKHQLKGLGLFFNILYTNCLFIREQINIVFK